MAMTWFSLIFSLLICKQKKTHTHSRTDFPSFSSNQPNRVLSLQHSYYYYSYYYWRCRWLRFAVLVLVLVCAAGGGGGGGGGGGSCCGGVGTVCSSPGQEGAGSSGGGSRGGCSFLPERCVQPLMAARNDTRTRARKGVGSSASRGGSPPVVDAVADALRNRGLHEWAIPLKNITCTEHCRPTNPGSVQDLVTRIGQVGWMPTALPQVTVPGVPEGEQMTDELAATLEVFVLDGNHRVKAAQQVYANDPDKTIRCSCYRDIDCTFTKKIISDGEKNPIHAYIMLKYIMVAHSSSRKQ